MCSIVQHPPDVTGFMSDHRFAAMSERTSSPQRRREEAFPVRSSLPSQEPSEEDIELAQHLLGHSQAIRNNHRKQEEELARDSPSPTYKLQSPSSSMVSAERARQITPRSVSTERNQRDSFYAPVTSPQSDSAPSGQICRYISSLLSC